MLVADKKTISKQNVVAEPSDLLDRQPFVDQLISIADILADNKKNACYAINGGWGVGKTYVLDMFEKQIRDYGQEGSTLSKFLVLHYNCWQYDYYEEPLIAIVSAIVDAINNEVCLLPDETKKLVTAALREIATDFLKEVNRLIKKKTGINIRKWVAFWKTAKEESECKIEEDHSFDTYFDFKKKLAKLKSMIGSLAKDQTILFVVDELDRCLPEYAIKVLERLHHVFNDIPNVQVVLSVDKHQLENTVSQIYGAATSVDSFLAKFIDFEVKLVVGEISNVVAEAYPQYMDCFTYDISHRGEIEELCVTILKGIEVRKCKAIVEKSYLCHRLLNKDGKCDASVLCIELLLTLLKEYGLKSIHAKNAFNINNLFTDKELFADSKHVLTGLTVLSGQYKSKPNESNLYLVNDRGRFYIRTGNLLGLILGCYRKILGFVDETWLDNTYSNVVVGDIDLQNYVLKYWKFLKTIN